jgi:hypothetical protein
MSVAAGSANLRAEGLGATSRDSTSPAIITQKLLDEVCRTYFLDKPDTMHLPPSS